MNGSINQIVLHDFEVMRELFDYDFGPMQKALNADCFSLLLDYENINASSKVFNKRIRDRICGLSRSLGEAAGIGGI